MTIAPQSGVSQQPAPTILLVENDVLVRMSLAEYLRDCGYRVVEARSVAEAKAVLDAGMRIALVFTKVRLAGGQSGFTLANWVRRRHPAVKVLLASGIANATEKAGDLCENGPMAAKPYLPDAVLRRIQSLLHQAGRIGSGRRKGENA